MKRFVPYEKMSKKQKRELDRQQRGSWGTCSPVTRKTENPRAYNRQKARRWSDDFAGVPFQFVTATAQIPS